MHNTTTPGKNRHPVDELADIREAQKKLKAREAVLKNIISKEMGDADQLGGIEFIARQKIATRKGNVDPAALKADGIDPDKYRSPDSDFYQILIERRAEEVR